MRFQPDKYKIMGKEEIWENKLSPLIEEAIHYLPRSFFYLHPFSLSLTFHGKSNLVVFEGRPGFWKFLPWWLSLLLIKGAAGGGSCFYVIFSYTFNFKLYSMLNIGIMDLMIALGLSVFTVSEVSVMLTLLRFPELLLAFNRFAELERYCKLVK